MRAGEGVVEPLGEKGVGLRRLRDDIAAEEECD